MSSNKRMKNMTIILGILLVVGLVFVSNQQGFAFFGQEVLIPEYFSASCIERPDSPLTKEIPGHTDDPTWYHCTGAEGETYIPSQGAGASCEYTVYDLAEFFGPQSPASVYVCQGDTEDEDDLDSATCSKKQGILDVVSRELNFAVPAGDSIYINTNKLIGDAKVRASYPWYGLEATRADGFKLPITESCDLRSLQKDYKTIGAGQSLIVNPLNSVNVATNFRSARSTQVITRAGINAGQPIYVVQRGQYNPIITADDGAKLVDVPTVINDGRIECIPGTPGCSSDATIIKLEEQECGAFAGTPEGYAPVEGRADVQCKYECVSGKFKVTDECVEIKKCPEDKPYFDFTEGVCKEVTQPSFVTGGEEDQTLKIILFVIAGLLIAIIGLMVFQQRKGKGKRRRRK